MAKFKFSPETMKVIQEGAEKLNDLVKAKFAAMAKEEQERTSLENLLPKDFTHSDMLRMDSMEGIDFESIEKRLKQRLRDKEQRIWESQYDSRTREDHRCDSAPTDILVRDMVEAEKFEIDLLSRCVRFGRRDQPNPYTMYEKDLLYRGIKIDDIIKARNNRQEMRRMRGDDPNGPPIKEFQCALQDGPASGRVVTVNNTNGRPPMVVQINAMVDHDDADDIQRYIKAPFKARMFTTLDYHLMGRDRSIPNLYLYSIKPQASLPPPPTTCPEQWQAEAEPPLTPAELLLQQFVEKE